MSPRPNPRRVLPILLAGGAVVAAVVWLVQSTQPPEDLTASGTVEAETVRIASEVGGRLLEVRAEAGDSVVAGQALLVLDDSLLLAQIERAAAGLETAQDGLRAAQAGVEAAALQLDIARSLARRDDAARQAQLWRGQPPGEIDLPAWYAGADEILAAAEASVAAAQAELEEARARLAALLKAPASERVRLAEQRLLASQAAFIAAAAADERARLAWETVDLLDAARQAKEEAEVERDAAQEAFDELLEEEAFAEIRQARAEVAFGEATLAAALAHRDAQRVGERSLAVQLAEVSLDQARAAAERAQSTLRQAEAELKLLEEQHDRMTVSAPRDGVILARAADPGEVLAPGAPALTLADLGALTITVYLAEDRYGEVDLGNRVEIVVDSLPGEVFDGHVVRIADRAEFTPRNVQTETGRRSTVFALQIAVDDPSGRLKPGMPADVTFSDDA